MPIEMTISRDRDSGSKGREVPIRTVGSLQATLPSFMGPHLTELGIVSVEDMRLDRDGVDQYVRVNGPLVGTEVTISLDPLSGRGEIETIPGKRVEIRVTEADILGRLRDRLVLRKDLMKPRTRLLESILLGNHMHPTAE